MITVRLKGGMGNQMFQYAFGRSLAKALNTELELDLSSLLDRSKKDFVFREYDLDIFKLEANFSWKPATLRKLYKFNSSTITRLVKKRIAKGKKVIKEPFFHVDESILNQPTNNSLYDGWWQSPKYFESVKEEIYTAFEFKDSILPSSQNLYNEIISSTSVCLNVRRTDFLKVDVLNTTNLDYFLRAANFLIETLIKEPSLKPSFFIFSDDVEWCQENIVLNAPVTIVDHSHKGRKFGNYLQLMKACKHYIIPNSSFAWWAIFLNKDPNKIVVAPKNWFNGGEFNTDDLIPENWHRL